MYRLPYTYGRVTSVAIDSFTMSYDHDLYDFPADSDYKWLLEVQGVAEFNHTGNTWLSHGLDVRASCIINSRPTLARIILSATRSHRLGGSRFLSGAQRIR